MSLYVCISYHVQEHQTPQPSSEQESNKIDIPTAPTQVSEHACTCAGLTHAVIDLRVFKASFNFCFLCQSFPLPFHYHTYMHSEPSTVYAHTCTYILYIHVYMRAHTCTYIYIYSCTHTQEDEWKEEEEQVQDLEGLRVQKLDIE